tara:strand:+ start:423 stop:878 length:456 start_codon:yes stop_codon:yes gene_type:complete
MISNYYYSWEEFLKDVHEIANQVYSSKFDPDVIMGVTRGGLTPAVSLSHLFKLPMVPIQKSLRDFPNWATYKPPKKHKKALIVDDICDGGNTFQKIKSEINEFCEEANFASLWWNNECDFKPNYFARDLAKDSKNIWIHFPWEMEKTSKKN